LPEDALRVRQVRLPERAPLAHQRIFTGDGVDEHVEAAVLAVDARDERRDLRLNRVIDADGNGAAAGRRNHLHGLVDRLGPAVRRRLTGDAAAGAVHGCAGVR
jgi:hypothetical protein